MRHSFGLVLASCRAAGATDHQGSVDHCLSGGQDTLAGTSDNGDEAASLLRDNVHLIIILTKAQNLAVQGCHVWTNWVPSHIALQQNDASEKAIQAARRMPSVTVAKSAAH